MDQSNFVTTQMNKPNTASNSSNMSACSNNRETLVSTCTGEHSIKQSNSSEINNSITAAVEQILESCSSSESSLNSFSELSFTSSPELMELFCETAVLEQILNSSDSMLCSSDKLASLKNQSLLDLKQSMSWKSSQAHKLNKTDIFSMQKGSSESFKNTAAFSRGRTETSLSELLNNNRLSNKNSENLKNLTAKFACSSSTIKAEAHTFNQPEHKDKNKDHNKKDSQKEQNQDHQDDENEKKDSKHRDSLIVQNGSFKIKARSLNNIDDTRSEAINSHRIGSKSPMKMENIFICFMNLMAKILGQAEADAHNLYQRIKERTDQVDIITLFISKINTANNEFNCSSDAELKALVDKVRSLGVDIPEGKYTWTEDEKRLLKENSHMTKDKMEKITQLERTDMQRFLQEASQCHQARSNVLKMLKELTDTFIYNLRP